jgi:membrane-bound lytic murein transglycosylase
MKTKEEILSAIATDNTYESWSQFLNDSHEHTQMEATMEAMQAWSDQDNAELKAEIASLRSRLDDCKRREVTGQRV